jgi:hypothetical protein
MQERSRIALSLKDFVNDTVPRTAGQLKIGLLIQLAAWVAFGFGLFILYWVILGANRPFNLIAFVWLIFAAAAIDASGELRRRSRRYDYCKIRRL